MTATVHELFAPGRLQSGPPARGSGRRLGAVRLRAAERRSSNAQRAAARLLGATIPEIALRSLQGGSIEMSFLTRNAAIVYFYPGLLRGDIAATDAALASGFRANYARLLQRGYHLFGVHAQHPGHQLHLMAEGVEHCLCADPELKFADMMAVPTYRIGPARVYRPLTLVVEGSKVVRVFYPLDRPAESATQLLAWLGHFRPEGAAAS